MGSVVAAGDTARVWVQLFDTVDVCGQRECVLVVHISPVQPRDSLMGFNLGIRFNPEKLRFHTMLTSGTLAESMEQRGFGRVGEELRAYAFTLTHTVSGTQPLVAFLGDYRLECPDTSLVQLLFVEFNEEFERRRTVVVDTLPTSIVARAVDAPGRRLRTRTLVREWYVAGNGVDTVLPVAVEYDTTLRLTAAQTFVSGLPQWLSVEEVSIAGGMLQGWERSGETVTVSWLPQGQAHIALRLRVQERRADTAELFFLTQPHDSCSCITRWDGDSLRIINTPIVSVVEPTAVLPASEQVCLEPGERLELYDLLGRLRWQGTALGQRHCIPLYELPAGLYFGRRHRFGECVPVILVR